MIVAHATLCAGTPVSALAKLSRPRLRAVYVVRRLLSRLEQARAAPAVWIVGPSGAGKTTLAATYLKTRRRPSLWYRVDEGDGDAAAFFHDLSLAIQRVAPRAQLPVYTVEHAAAVVAFARRFFRAAWQKLGRRVLVLDNYQDAPARSPFHEVMRAALQEMPSGAGAIIASRSPPPAALARLRAEGAVAVIPPAELRLTPLETAGLARARGRALTASEAERLHRSTAGWAAGIVLMLAGGREGEPVSRQSVRAPSELLEYFASEIFEPMPAATRRVLLETALLPRVPAELAEGLTGEPRARAILAGLARAGCFTFRMDDQGEVYDYHPLFRQFLLERGEDSLEPSRRRQIQAAAAKMLAAAGDDAAAVELLRAAGAGEELGQLVAARAPQLWAQGKLQTLARWLGSVPREVVDASPWLLYWLAMAAVFSEAEQSRREAERALALFEARGHAAGAYLAWAAGVDSYLFARGDHAGLSAWLDAFARLRASHPAIPGPEVESRVTLTAYSALMFHRTDHPAAPEWEERALTLALGHGPPPLRVAAGSRFLVCSGYQRGEIDDAKSVLEALGGVARSPEVGPNAGIMWRVGEAAFHLHTGEPGAARRLVDEGLAIAEETGLRVWDVVLLFHGTIASLALEDLGEAARALQAMRRALREGSRLLDRATQEQAAALVALRTQDYEEAAARARRGEEIYRRAAYSPFSQASCALAQARAQLGLGALDEAAEQIQLARRLGEAARSRYIEFLAGLLEALLLLERGQAAAAATALRPSFADERFKSCAAAMISRADWAELCALAIGRDIEPDRARKLVRSHRLPAPDRAPAQWPWALRVTTLGAFQVETEGGVLRFGRKAPLKPLELLKALIALGPGFVAENRLCDVLWPDADGDAGRHALETTVYRLRKLLPEAVLQRSGRLALDPQRCWVDVDAVERLAERALSGGAAIRQAVEPLLGDAEQALALYRGPFLPGDEDRPWTISRRERSRRAVRRLVERASGRLSAAGRGEAARDLEERAAHVGLESRVALASA